jgi:hypothetical protein
LIYSQSILLKTTIKVSLAALFASLCNVLTGNFCLADAPTVLPTDLVPVSSNRQQAEVHGLNNLSLRLWQHLPASFYFTGSVEETFRLETNPFQYPNKRTILQDNLPVGTNISDVSPSDIYSIDQEISHSDVLDQVNRANPTLVAGWALTPNTQVFSTYFLLRDSLFHNSSINSTTQAVGIGAQHSFTLGKKTTLQPQIIGRELFQTAEPPVFDYLPAINLQRTVTPNLVAYLNALLQVRLKDNMAGPGRELDPMYTAGLVWQRGQWSFLSTCTFLQNFRHQFGANALIPINNYTFVLDFEIDRNIKKIPGLQAIIRAEPVYNFHDQNTPGISGMDFRLYYGLRLSAVKPWLTNSIQQLKQRYQIMEQPNP